MLARLVLARARIPLLLLAGFVLSTLLAGIVLLMLRVLVRIVLILVGHWTCFSMGRPMDQCPERQTVPGEISCAAI